MKVPLQGASENDLRISLSGATLFGDLRVPPSSGGLVIFAHGSGSGRKSSRNRFVAEVLQKRKIGTLLFDLLTLEEERVDSLTARLRFDIGLLAGRLRAVTEWMLATYDELPIGYFGASTGAAAALIAAAELGPKVRAVVSRGGRPDLAGAALARVGAPTLLVVGGEDHGVIGLNESAFEELRCEKQLRIVAGANHLFEEPGTLAQAAEMAAEWFSTYLPVQPRAAATA